MSPEEEKELESLLNACVTGLTDIDELSDHLTSQLGNLEVENVHGIIESDLAIRNVVHRLDETSEQLLAVEKWLNDYNAQLTV